ncbi:MAG TPA: phosphatidylserine decarboxylase [Vicinamibacterales bacterium]|nr:phosphatidylserine decarboxylase [Vicinamibacterales bacterium]HPW21909.1 phosphatidylserine decarboxylase [Vicinamibacterales bacterium]
MKIDRAGWPFVFAFLVPAAACALAGWIPAAAMAALGAGSMLFFFRDPERRTPGEPEAVVSPADGRVLVAGRADPLTSPPPGEWTQLSIFLSPLDVHVNRIPIGGRVVKVERTPGRFLAAYRPDSARVNEKNDVWIERGSETVVCRQVVGVLARRLVCRVGPGSEVATGQRFGLMKFGSRIDLYLPPRIVLCVAEGARVRGGETVVARW